MIEVNTEVLFPQYETGNIKIKGTQEDIQELYEVLCEIIDLYRKKCEEEVPYVIFELEEELAQIEGIDTSFKHNPDIRRRG